MGVVILALIGLGVSRFLGRNGGGGDEPKAKDIDRDSLGMLAEAPDGQAATTVREYNYVAAQRLPDVRGVSSYKPMQNRTVRMALNVWAGWAPVIHANNGFKAGKVWKDARGQDFRLELVLIDDPVAMRDAYASGDIHIGWATLDMLPLMMEGLRRDSRTMPRVYQQIDWSNGGDGIVCRANVATMADVRGKTIVLAQNSPSHFFALNALINAGLQPGDVQWKFTQDAFQAAAAFNADRNLACVVSWAPDIYNLADVRGNKMMVTTKTANKLIADVWFARADFAKDNPAIIEGLVRGIFDSVEALKAQDQKQLVAQLMADGYSIPPADALGMLGDAHWTNYAENRDFFLNQNNPTNFERIWNTAYFLYRRIGQVGTKTEFDQVLDFSVIKKLETEPKYANQRNEYNTQFAATTASAVAAEAPELLTKTVVINFFPNSWDLRHKVTRVVDGKPKEEVYDPNVDFLVDEIGQLAGQYGAARIVIEGHTDGSMQGQVPKSFVQELSLNRANAVKEAVLRKFPDLDPNQFATVGMAWDRPADANDPQNHAKNRRVEVKVYPAEAVS
ncbi:MAG TPA: phosphate ABC transporter substrate-binding/OmpA family protein [Longimicrobiaceae bacterium]|nr:phosphate ABC transporter substrate-binding/OmpA family protein [Longimicrobiaceae bacterium]